MRNKIGILVAVLLLLTGAILLYLNIDKLKLSKSLEITELFPQNAIMVFESPDLINKWNEFVESSMWKNLSTLEEFSSIDQMLKEMDDLTGNSGQLDKITKNRGFYISTHVISNQEYDHVYYIDVTQPQLQEQFFSYLNSGFKDGEFSQSERNYSNQRIFELSKPTSEGTFLSYILVDNILVLSKTAYLVEDVIRTLQGEPSFFEDKENLSQVTRLQYDAGNIYLNLKELASYVKLFFNNSDEEFLFPLQSLSGSAFFDVDFDDEYTFFNGLVYPVNDNLIKIFNGQESAPINFLNLIPERTSSLFYYQISSPVEFYADLWEHMKLVDSQVVKAHQDFLVEQVFDLDRFLNWWSSGVVMIDLESLDPTGREKLILIGTKDINDALNQFSGLADQLNAGSEDTLYTEYYSEIEITLIDEPEFPLKILGKGFEGFDATFFTAFEDYIVLANDVEAIKTLIDSHQNDETWLKSLSKSEFIDLGLEDSNVGVILNLPRFWKVLSSRLSPIWLEKFTENRNNLLHFDLWSVQFNVQDDNYYSNLLIHHRPFSDYTSSSSQVKTVFETELKDRISIKPVITRNHNNGSREVFLQDSVNRIYLIDQGGNILWEDSLDSRISSEVFQIDYYRNQKLQIAFLAGRKLYLIDRNGVSVEGFPKFLEDFEPLDFNVIDYDNSRNYRFLFREINGDVWLTDKEVNVLEGWGPNSLNGSLAFTPIHKRIRGRDVFVMVKSNGSVVVTNRRGEMLTGFPVDLGTRVSGDIYIETKPTFNNSLMYVVSEEGELISIQMDGQIKDRKQLYRPSKDTFFKLINETQNKTFVVSRQDYNSLSILNRNGDLIFEKDYFSSDPFQVKYYNFGSSTEVFMVRVPAEGNAHLYDENGSPIVYPSIKSDYPLSIIYHENRTSYTVYGVVMDKVFQVTIE